MTQHWSEKYKRKAKNAFAQERGRKIGAEPSKPNHPRPQLTPNGPMRSTVDAKVREEMNSKRAQIIKKKKEIQAKLEQDRRRERALER